MKSWARLAWVLGLIAASPAIAQQGKTDLTVPSFEALQPRLEATMRSTRPDFVVFRPTMAAGVVSDTGNEHFLAFDGPDGSLMAIWTQSTFEGQPDQHIAFSRSTDEGQTWSPPKIIAGPSRPGEKLMASWAFPMVSRSGRIYVLYSQNVGKHDTFPHTTGTLDGVFSDDQGQTWSAPETIDRPRTSRDNPDASFPANCITWQKPVRLTRDGRYLVGLTRWTSSAVKKNPGPSWTSHDSVVEMMRFENLDDDPPVSKLTISWLAWDQDALTVPHPGFPGLTVCQEPSLVKLPDGRIFNVMRTMAGGPYWSVSQDDGATWTKPRPLLRKDGGEPLRHPLSPCPIFDLGGPAAGSGLYALFIHNHDGHYQGLTPVDTNWNRRPVYLVRGHFQAGADQPVWFDEPELFMDHDGLPLGPPGKKGRLDLALYSSITRRQGKTVLWYPDRKFFLLGKILPGPE